MISPRYLTTTEVVARYGWPSAQAFRQFLYRRRKAGRPVTTRRMGRSLKFLESDLEAVMTVEEQRPRLRRPA